MMDTPSGALFSPCRLYRYLLWRIWAGPADNVSHPKLLLWIMLNPSTADAAKDDATIRVCVGRAKRLGYGGLVVANLFALRATNPTALYDASSPISEPGMSWRNGESICAAVAKSEQVICAWGRYGAYLNQGMHVLSALRGCGVKPWALKLNRDGTPAHPLRIPYSQPLVRI